MATAKTPKKEVTTSPSGLLSASKKPLAEFAIIETGGKQYLVAEGDMLKIEKMVGAHAVGDFVAFEKVLLHEKGADTTIGMPYIKGATVSAEIKKISRAKKVVVIKYKAKSNYFKKRGHRQPYFEVQITALK